MAKANGPTAHRRGCGWPVFTGAPGRRRRPGAGRAGSSWKLQRWQLRRKVAAMHGKCMAMPAEMAQNLVSSTSSSSNFEGLIYTIPLLVMLGMAYGISCATFGGIGIRLEPRDAEVGMSWSNSRPMQWEVLTFHCHCLLEGNGLHMRGQVARTKF